MIRSTAIVALAFLAACGTEENPTDNGNGTPTEGVECQDNVCVLSGTITEDLTLTADNAYLLRGGVFIGDDENPVTLTIEAGTTIYGETSTDGMLVVRRNAKIMAEGTADAPIVFTSSKEAGSRARGDWGGLIINGKAPVNSCDIPDGEPAEGGFCEAYGEGATGWYGGNDSADNSGVLKYVRVEFAGTLVSPENELNGIAFQGVGSGTTIDFVQVHMNADDGIEFFGGNAQFKHILITGAGDDSFDWTDGWQGKGQFFIAQQYDDAGDQGIEADNNGENNAAAPRSNPTLANLTLIGSPESSASDLGILLREGTAVDIANSLVLGFNDACLDVDHSETWGQLDAGNLNLWSTSIDCANPYKDDAEDGEPAADIEAWFLGNNGNDTANAGLADPFNIGAPGFTPAAAGAGTEALSDAFFDAAAYRGAVDPAGTDWTAGWTTAELN